MQFNLSQNTATLLHLVLAFLQAVMIAFAPWSLDQKAVIAGFLAICQGALGYRAFNLTPAGNVADNPPTKQQVEGMENAAAAKGKNLDGTSKF